MPATSDGRSVVGEFHLSCLPRKRGHFVFEAVDPSTVEPDARWWPESVAALTNRAMVRWIVGSVDRRVRQQEVLAGAAAVQEAAEAEDE